MKSKLINTTSTIKSSTNSTSSVDSNYGNTLRDATLQFQLDNEVGNHLKVAINGGEVEIYLLSKTNNVLGGCKFKLEIETKELVSVSLDSDNKQLDFLFDDDSHLYADLSSLYSLIETNKENINKVVDQVNEYIEETDEHLENLDNYTSSLQSSLDTLTKKEKADFLTLSNEITSINDKIPTEATSTNQLADKDFVNSSIATATASFRGTVNSKEELKKLIGDLNDYAYIEVKDETTGLTLRYDRYKYTSTVSTETGNWAFEYSLNNSSFTAEQWAAINSTITKDLVGQISTNKSDIVSLNTRVTNNEEDIATLENNLNNEISRATKAETTLQTNIDAEVTRATTKESELEAAIKEAGKIDDVKVNGTSVVTDKVANIDLTNYVDLTSEQSISGKKIFEVKPCYATTSQELPEGYTAVEYISGVTSPDAYIDTGIKAVAPVSWKITFMLNTLDNQCIIGARAENSRVWNMVYANKFEMGVGVDHALEVLAIGKKYVAMQYNKAEGYAAYLDDTLKVSGSDVANLNTNLYIGKVNNSLGGSSYGAGANIYSCKIWQGEILVRDYIPCINSSNIAGLYDLVNNKFYSSSSSQQFTAGSALITTEFATMEDINNLDMSAVTFDPSQTVSYIKEANGIVSVTTQDIAITQSQITDIATLDEVNAMLEEVYN